MVRVTGAPDSVNGGGWWMDGRIVVGVFGYVKKVCLGWDGMGWD